MKPPADIFSVISVVIPTYNCSAYIAEALDSVLAQTVSDHEIIVVDDGSTDATGEIVQERYPMVRYVRKEQGGVSSARNLGITLSRGEYVAFLDADDLWVPDKLERQLGIFAASPDLAMVFTENSTFDLDKRIVDRGFNKRERIMKGDVVRNIFLRSYVTTSTVMVKKNIFYEVGLFHEGLHAGEDDNLWMRIAMRYPIELIDESLVRYRLTENSLCRSHGNLLEGVKKHIELIRTDYPRLYSRLGRRALWNKAYDIHFCEAYHYVTRKSYRLARPHLLQCMRYKPWSFRTYPYYLLCCFPPLIIDAVKQWKQRLATRTMR